MEDESSNKDEPTVNKMYWLTNAMEHSLQMGRREAFSTPDLPRWQVAVAILVFCSVRYVWLLKQVVHTAFDGMLRSRPNQNKPPNSAQLHMNSIYLFRETLIKGHG